MALQLGASRHVEGESSLLQRVSAPLSLVARVLMAGMFIHEGYGKITDYGDTVDYMQSFGVNGHLLPLVILTELGGGLMILLGFGTRLAAIALAGFALLTAIFFHTNFADAMEAINFQKNLTIAGGFLILALAGPGAWSIDTWRDARLTVAIGRVE